MAPSSPAADVASFCIWELGALLAGVALLFLWRQSRVAYFGLLAAALAIRVIAGIFTFEWWSESHSAWLTLYAAFEFAALAALVAAMAIRSGRHAGRTRELRAEMDRLRREAAQSLDLDRLTGLLNQAALARRLEEPPSFQGVVAVCDMDGFKDINDRYGHLVGDEILRNIGHLLHTSIRHEDEAFRWGGDEFVILFHNQLSEVARRRMADIEARLQGFRVRGVGALPISFSWGTAEALGRALREALDEADRNMYAGKRKRAANVPEPRPPAV
jgi:diguanylate cyclase (GGDEF)-like protein